MARGYPIKGNHTSRTPRACIAIGVSAVKHVDACGRESLSFGAAHSCYWRAERGAVRCDDERDHPSTESLWRWVSEHLPPGLATWIWLHDGIRSLTLTDWWGLWDSGRFAASWYVLDDSRVIIKGKLDSCEVKVCDIANWLPHSLDDIGGWCDRHEPDADHACLPSTMLLAVAAHRSRVVRDAVQRLCCEVRDLDLGSMRYTASSQAFRHWQHTYKGPAVVPSASSRECELARSAYYSGRTELFRIGPVNGPIYVLDANGMYAAAMVASMQPRKMIDYSDCIPSGVLPPCNDSVGYIAECRIKTCQQYPYRERDVGTIYPTGEYWTVLAGPELHAAISRGDVQEVRRAASYHMAPVCREFAEFWWARRCEYKRAGDAIMANFAKSMPCCLYGRWGQTSHLWEQYGPEEYLPRYCVGRYHDHVAKKHHPSRVIAGIGEVDRSRVYRVVQRDGELSTVCQRNYSYQLETPYSFPAIAAWITSQARVMMDTYRMAAGTDHVYYQCHDAIHVDRVGYDALCQLGYVKPDVLGRLKLKARHDRIEYYGINLLRVDGVFHAAGLSTAHMIGPDGTVTQTAYEGLASLLERGMDGTVRLRRNEWAPTAKYRHGVPLESGRVSPIVLSLGGDSGGDSGGS